MCDACTIKCNNCSELIQTMRISIPPNETFEDTRANMENALKIIRDVAICNANGHKQDEKFWCVAIRILENNELRHVHITKVGELNWKFILERSLWTETHYNNCASSHIPIIKLIDLEMRNTL